jgi:hypothetical protein
MEPCSNRTYYIRKSGVILNLVASMFELRPGEHFRHVRSSESMEYSNGTHIMDLENDRKRALSFAGLNIIKCQT